MSSIHFEALNKEILDLKNSILNHPLYPNLQSLEQIRILMEHHVFAVWDFMSLLKTLQQELTCTRVPWFPVGNPETRYLINEIVVGEECDLDDEGERRSHFELYLKAMEKAGANTQPIKQFILFLQQGHTLEEAIALANIPNSAGKFIKNTFSVIDEPKPYLHAAVFTFGREDLIPGMFYSIVNDLTKATPGQLSTFKYYLERHIEVDGGHHSQLALQMTASLCGEDELKWKEATQAIIHSLRMRKTLWDGVLAEIKSTIPFPTHSSASVTN
jgi:hypothetical protein